MDDGGVGQQCLQIIDTVICYSLFPNESLLICILALCRTVNLVPYCQLAWKVLLSRGAQGCFRISAGIIFYFQIMRNLLGTSSGHEALLTMCRILNDRCLYNDEVLLRGAVFHIYMGVWNSNSTTPPVLKTYPSTILRSFLNVSLVFYFWTVVFDMLDEME